MSAGGIDMKNLNGGTERRTLVYVPCYECRNTVLTVLDRIPETLHESIVCLVVDNSSSDGTAEHLVSTLKNRDMPFPVAVVRTARNTGYAGSQKLAYGLACLSGRVDNVIMLHGDGQYDADMLTGFAPYIGKCIAVVQGYRDKVFHAGRDETPFLTYCVIRVLSGIESVATGFPFKEWHSGFVMYSTDFLGKVPLARLSNTRHIDGELLIAAGTLREETAAIPIYKRYREHEALGGVALIKHILDTVAIMLKCRSGGFRRLMQCPPDHVLPSEFEVLMNSTGVDWGHLGHQLANQGKGERPR
jgi:glycosyltransferase involved in cell wall biosynthesis